MSSLYTQIHLSLSVTGGSLVVASDSTPGAEFPAYAAVMGGSWLQDSYQQWIPAGYYPLFGEDAEEVVHQAQQVGLSEGSLQRLADVLSDMADRQITDTLTGLPEDETPMCPCDGCPRPFHCAFEVCVPGESTTDTQTGPCAREGIEPIE